MKAIDKSSAMADSNLKLEILMGKGDYSDLQVAQAMRALGREYEPPVDKNSIVELFEEFIKARQEGRL